MLWASAAEIAGVGKLALPSSRPGLLTKLGLTWIVAALSMPARVSTPAKKWLASLGTLTPVVVVGSALEGEPATKASVPVPLLKVMVEEIGLPSLSVIWMVLAPVAVTWMFGDPPICAWMAAAIAVVVPAAMPAVVKATGSIFPVNTSPAAAVPVIVWTWVDMTWARFGGLAAGLAVKVSVPVPLLSLKLEVRAFPAASVTWIVFGPVEV